MKNRIDLTWGGGMPSVILDLCTRDFVISHDRASAEQIVAAYGGKHYYTSKSGLSGAGWIPARPYLLRCDVYRSHPMSHHTNTGARLCVPVERDRIDWNLPIIIGTRDGYSAPILVEAHDTQRILDALAGELAAGDDADQIREIVIAEDQWLGSYGQARRTISTWIVGRRGLRRDDDRLEYDWRKALWAWYGRPSDVLATGTTDFLATIGIACAGDDHVAEGYLVRMRRGLPREYLHHTSVYCERVTWSQLRAMTRTELFTTLGGDPLEEIGGAAWLPGDDLALIKTAGDESWLYLATEHGEDSRWLSEREAIAIWSDIELRARLVIELRDRLAADAVPRAVEVKESSVRIELVTRSGASPS